MKTSHLGWPLPRRPVAGARVGLIAPAGPVTDLGIETAEETCRALGWAPVVAEGARGRHGYLAGPDAARLDHVQRTLDDPSIDLVWALRGGYGSQRIIDRLSLARQRRDPIPFIGFSDNTTLLMRHAVTEVGTFHGPHPGMPLDPWSRARLLEVLCGSEPAGVLPRDPEAPALVSLVDGVAEGPLVVGNLAILSSLCGTPDALPLRGRILCVEDVGEPPYRVDRMLVQLQRSGLMEGVLGLVFGRFCGRPDGEEEAVLDVLGEFAEHQGVPSMAFCPFGHIARTWTLPVGGVARLDASSCELALLEVATRLSE